MLTSFYYPIRILKSLFPCFSTSLPNRGKLRSLLMGLLGRMAGQEDIAITEIANLLGVSRQAVYGNIDRVEAIEPHIQALPDAPFNCLIVTPKDIDKAILSLDMDAESSHQ